MAVLDGHASTSVLSGTCEHMELHKAAAPHTIKGRSLVTSCAEPSSFKCQISLRPFPKVVQTGAQYLYTDLAYVTMLSDLVSNVVQRFFHQVRHLKQVVLVVLCAQSRLCLNRRLDFILQFRICFAMLVDLVTIVVSSFVNLVIPLM